MFFPESEAIVRKHQDLRRVVELVDEQLSTICSPAPLRPTDFCCALGAEMNQVESVFELMARAGVLLANEMVECEHCHNLMSADAFRQAAEDEEPFECTGCGRVFRRRSEPIILYRMTGGALSRTKAVAKPLALQISEIFGTPTNEEPLSERARLVLVAMLELDALDSDRRQPTEEVAVKALGAGADPNALKSVMAELNTRGLINSKTGRGGGCWLTENGRQRAEKLRDPNRNSATV